jgi:hypothetical protein
LTPETLCCALLASVSTACCAVVPLCAWLVWMPILVTISLTAELIDVVPPIRFWSSRPAIAVRLRLSPVPLALSLIEKLSPVAGAPDTATVMPLNVMGAPEV